MGGSVVGAVGVGGMFKLVQTFSARVNVPTGRNEGEGERVM